VAKSATGKWVSRVGASGGGKAYKKARPGNYYGILAVIVILGLVATIFSRYEYQHPGHAAASTPPAIGTTWYASLGIEACGKRLPYLPTDPTTHGGFVVGAANVIRISPVSAADAGAHATLSQFAAEYPGLIASTSELAIPTATGTQNPKTTFRNGDTCPATSKYKGTSGTVSYAYWTIGQKTPTITTDPTKIKFSRFLRVTLAFEPAGVTPMLPRQASINGMYAAAQSTTTTTVATPSTLPTTTTTLSGATTTTTGATTTTTVKTTTTTAAQG